MMSFASLIVVLAMATACKSPAEVYSHLEALMWRRHATMRLDMRRYSPVDAFRLLIDRLFRDSVP